MKSFVSKPVYIEGKLFDGTRASAKEIVDWMKDDPNANYQSAEFRERVEEYGFGAEQPHAVDHHKVLTINANDKHHYIEQGNWLVRYVETGEYSYYPNGRLIEKFTEL